MATHPFYNTTKWRSRRTAILKRDNYLCQINKRYGKTEPAITVHHVIPLDWCLIHAPHLALASINLISVSDAAHNGLHDRFTGRLSMAGIDLVKRMYGKNMPEGWEYE